MATTIIKGKRKLSNEEKKCMSSVSLDSKKVQGSMSSIQKCNIKHPLSDGAIIFTAIETYLQYTVHINYSVEKGRLHQI